MEKVRKCYHRSLQIVILAVVLLLNSCTIPKIVIYDDPLGAKEHNDLGVIYEKKGKFELAEKEYKKAIEKDRNWYVPYFNLANLYYKQRDIEKAIEFYKLALEKDENADVLNNIAYVLYEAGRYQEALYYIEKAITMDKKDEYIDTYNKIIQKVNSPSN